MTQPSLFPEPSFVSIGVNGVALCTLCTASYPAPGDVVTDTERWAAWHASRPHTIPCGGLLLTGELA